MSSPPYIFSIPFNESSFTFKDSELPLTLDETTRTFFIDFLQKTNNSFNDIRESFFKEKNSSTMDILCCLLGCTIIGIIPCCFWINRNIKKLQIMNNSLDLNLNLSAENLTKTLKDFNGIAVVKKKPKKTKMMN